MKYNPGYTTFKDPELNELINDTEDDPIGLSHVYGAIKQAQRWAKRSDKDYTKYPDFEPHPWVVEAIEYAWYLGKMGVNMTKDYYEWLDREEKKSE